MNHKLNALLSVLLLASMVLAGCASASPAAAPAPAVPPTQPSVTQVAGSCTAPAPFDPATAPLPANPKSITIALSQEPDNQNSLFSAMSYVAWIGQMNLIGLGKWDDKNNFVPDLAAEIPTADNGGVSADGLTITWKLKTVHLLVRWPADHIQGCLVYLASHGGSKECALHPRRL